MTAWICATCGVQHAPADSPPGHCAICDDERQYVGHGGQRWTTLTELAQQGHRSVVREQEPADRHRGGAVVRHRAACAAGADRAGQPAVRPAGLPRRCRRRGGARARGAGRYRLLDPHFHGVQVEWSEAFGGVPVWVCADDLAWVQRPSPPITAWRGHVEVLLGVTLVQCGGHFAGSAVVHGAGGAEGRGVLLVGDTVTVVMDRRHVSFMRSYPNHLPLPAAAVRQVVDALAPYGFDQIYGGWWTRVIDRGGQEAIHRSAERCLSWISGEAWTEESP